MNRITLLQLDTHFPRIPGDVGSVDTYKCELEIIRVPNATVEQVVNANPSQIDLDPFFDAIDKAWASLDLETVKSYISDDAVMKFADGKVAIGGDEFVEMIQQEVEQWGEAEYVWTTDYKFSLATTSDNDDSTNVDQGDWVNAQFTQELETPVDGNKRNVYYEFYHIIDGKVVSWNQFKRGEKE